MQKSDQSELSLKTLRERTGLSQEKLGRKLDLSFRTFADWEAGKKFLLASLEKRDVRELLQVSTRAASRRSDQPTRIY